MVPWGTLCDQFPQSRLLHCCLHFSRCFQLTPIIFTYSHSEVPTTYHRWHWRRKCHYTVQCSEGRGATGGSVTFACAGQKLVYTNSMLDLEILTKKLCTLLCLLSGQRAQAIPALTLDMCYRNPEATEYILYIDRIMKTSKPGHHVKPMELRPKENIALFPAHRDTQWTGLGHTWNVFFNVVYRRDLLY